MVVASCIGHSISWTSHMLACMVALELHLIHSAFSYVVAWLQGMVCGHLKPDWHAWLVVWCGHGSCVGTTSA